MSLYVQYGCGLSAPAGWQNFDGSPRLYLERLPLLGHGMKAAGKALFPANVRYGNIVAGLPVAEASVDGLYCSHVLEHIDRAGVERALANSLRMLRPGGVFRLIVPDLVWRAKAFLDGVSGGERDAADRFLRESYLGQEHRPTGVVGRLRGSFGNADHRWMYDFGQMALLLEQAGFTAIRPCEIGDAEDRKFDEVEEYTRFFEGENREVAIEARRPVAA